MIRFVICLTVLLTSMGWANDSIAQLRLLSPKGGETFIQNDSVSVVIRWTGVSATQPLELSYSTDQGNSWDTITTTATGLQYTWIAKGFNNKQCVIRAIARISRAGMLDSTFTFSPPKLTFNNKTISATFTGYTNSIFPDDNDKIFIGGRYSVDIIDTVFGIPIPIHITDKGLFRLNENGNIDTTFKFSSDSSVVSAINRLPNKNIVVGFDTWSSPGHYNYWYLGSYNRLGNRDTIFNRGLPINQFDNQLLPIGAIYTRNDDKLFIIANNPAYYDNKISAVTLPIFLCDSQGKQDTMWKVNLVNLYSQVLPFFTNKDIKDIAGFIGGAVVLPNNSLILSLYLSAWGSDTNISLLIRINNDGTLDSSFGHSLSVIGANLLKYPFSSMSILSDGKILCSSVTANLYNGILLNSCLVRLNSDGTIDHSLKADSTITRSRQHIIQEDGKIISLAYDASKITRFNHNGSIDHSFRLDPIIESMYYHTLTIGSDGNVLMSNVVINTGDTVQIARILTKGERIESDKTNIFTINTPQNPVTGISGTINYSKTSLVVYPTIVNKKITINYFLSQASNVEIFLMDGTGHKLQDIFNKKQISGYHVLNDDLSEFPSGMYFIVLLNNNRAFVEKIMIVR